VIASINNMPSFGQQVSRAVVESATHVPVANEKNPGVVFTLTLVSAHGLAIPAKPRNSTLQ